MSQLTTVSHDRPPAPLTGTGTLKDLLSRADVRAAVQSVVPRTMTPERILKVALSTVSRNPGLAKCDNMSILKCLMVAAELGLDPSGTLGQGYLVPFRNNKSGRMEAQFIPGYRGLMALARRSGTIASLHAEVVYSHDTFKVTKGCAPTITHEPDYDSESSDTDIIGAYAVAVFKDGTVQFEYLPRREIEKVRQASRAGDQGPWVSWYPEMCKKTAVRRLCKFLPLQVEEPLSRAVELENRAECGDGIGELLVTGDGLEAAEEPAKTPVDDAKERMREKQAASKPQSTPTPAPSPHSPRPGAAVDQPAPTPPRPPVPAPVSPPEKPTSNPEAPVAPPTQVESSPAKTEEVPPAERISDAVSQLVEEYKLEAEASETLTGLRELKNHAEANETLAGSLEAKAIVLKMISDRGDAIRASRGGRSTATPTR